jgi:hydrogenase-4 component E
MSLASLPPVAAAVFSLLAVVSLLLAFVMLGSRWLAHYVAAFAAESWLIAALSAAVAYYGHFPELYAIAALTAVFRGGVLPWLLLRIVRRLNVEREMHAVLQPATALVLGGGLVVVALTLAERLGSTLRTPEEIVILALAVMLSMKLLGFLMLVVRDEALSQILALLVLENGIFLGSQLLVPGMPMLLEIVILFDLLVVVACFGVLVRYLLVHAGTTSGRELTRLAG